MDVQDTDLPKQHVLAIITAVNLSYKIIELFIGENDPSDLDPGLLTKAVTILMRLDLVNTKLTWQQDKAILGTLDKGCKIGKLYNGYKDMLTITLNGKFGEEK